MTERKRARTIGLIFLVFGISMSCLGQDLDNLPLLFHSDFENGRAESWKPNFPEHSLNSFYPHNYLSLHL